MKFSRTGVALVCLFSLLVAGSAIAQSTDSSGEGATGGGSTILPTAPSTTPMNNGASAPTPTGSLGGIPSAEPAAATPPATPPTEAATPIKLPEGFGSSTITPGEGRFAQPPFRLGISFSQGYDDNVLTTPDNPATPQPTYSYSYEARKTFTGYYNINQGGLNPVPIYTTGTYLVATRLPPAPQQQKIGSPVTRSNLSLQTQSANPRTVYTFDLGLGATEYWDRPGDTLEYNGSLGFLLFHKVSPRINFTAGGSANYSSQPNYGNLYGPTSQNTGQYISGNLRANIAYRASPRISTNLNYNLATTLYQESTAQGGNLYNNTLGFEFNYLVSPRATAVLNYRASSVTYPQSSASDSTENFALLGLDLDLSQRIHFTFRTGGQSKVYSNAGSTGLSSPYFESNLNYVYGKGSTLNWTTRYGFEESPSRSSSQKTVSFRTGLGVNQVLTARISANAGLNWNRVTTSSTTDLSTASTDQDELSLNLGLNYTASPHLSFNLTYSFTQTMSTYGYSDYTRNQTFLGANYSF